MNRFIITFIGLVSVQFAHPAVGDEGDQFFVAYAGQYSDSTLAGEILALQPIKFEDAYMATVGLGKVFARPNERRQWELEVQLAKWFGDQDNFEFNVAAIHRWKRFPWDHHVDTSLAFGSGLSFASETPKLEEELETTGSNPLLVYLSLEAAFSPPGSEHWAVFLRIHHRSGVFGLINGVDGGSNTLTLGMRFNHH